MTRRVCYIVFCAMLASCASKKMTSSIQNLEMENKTLRGDVARLQDEVRGLSNDVMVVQSRVSSQPAAPVAMSVKPAEPVEPAKKMYREESFLGDNLHFTDDEPAIKSATNSVGSIKFTNKDLSNLPPLIPGQRPNPNAEKSKSNGFAETTLIAPKTEAKQNIEDPSIVASYNLAYKTFTDQNYKETIRLMTDFVQKYPSHQYSDNAIFWIGESYFQLKNYEQANVEFQKVITTYPNGNKVPDAMLRSGICSLRMSKPDVAKASFEQLIRKYPESVAAKRAKATTGEL